MPPATSRSIARCQISNSTNLRSVLFLGFAPPVNDMQPVGGRPVERTMYPLELLYCPDSNLVQIGCQVDPEILFPPEYPYTSGTTRILRENFSDLFEQCRNRLGIDGSTFVIDIGSNDGTLLSNFKAGGCRVLGIDPTDRARLANERGIHSLRGFFSRESARSVAAEYGAASLVTATNVFAHMPDIDEVVAGIPDILDESGVFVSESHYLLDLIGTLQYDTVYHEHLRYYSLHSLKFLLEKHGLEIFHVKRIPTHGGSIRVFAARKGRDRVDPSVPNPLEAEQQAGLLDPETYRRFARHVRQSKLDLLSLLRDVKTCDEPADDRFNAGIIDSMYQEYRNGHHIVSASRFIAGGCMVGAPWLKSLLVRSSAFTLYYLARLPARDASNGLRLFSRRLLDRAKIESSVGFAYGIELLVKCHRLGWKVAEIPAVWYERTSGRSRFKVIRWLSEYLRWYFYAFATTYLRRGPETVPVNETAGRPS